MQKLEQLIELTERKLRALQHPDEGVKLNP
jgi:hypothetical protein